MRTADQWLDDYGDSHRNHTNKALHWICRAAVAAGRRVSAAEDPLLERLAAIQFRLAEPIFNSV